MPAGNMMYIKQASMQVFKSLTVPC